MKKFFFMVLVLVSLIFSGCGNDSNNSGTRDDKLSNDTGSVKIVFREYEHNFGKVQEGEKVSYQFSFDNKGTADLVIASATASCGCTIPEFDAKPIPPGGSGNIQVVFNTTGRNGIQTKTITVKSNATPPVALLKITTDVVNSNK
jgi:hypothetical protein